MAMIGKLIGNYQITADLAPGRLGPLFRGQSVDQSREVVIKTINLSIFPASTQVQLKARFRREVFVQRQLQHPNIVQVYDFLAAEDRHYLIQEYVPGSSLRELLNRQGVPNVAQAVFLVKQALAALDYAHRFSYLDQSDFQRTGLIHADIKPSNLLLDTRGRLRLADFGVVNKVLTGEGRKATAALFEQDNDYLAPEQARGLTPDASSDVYGLGVTFYEMLTGRAPYANWGHSDSLDMRRLTGEGEAQSLTQIRPDVPPQLALVVARAIRRNPKERFATAADFLRALQTCEPQFNTGELTLRTDTHKGTSRKPVPSGRLPVHAPPSKPLAPPRSAPGAPLQHRPPAQPTVRPTARVQMLPPERPSMARPVRVEPLKRNPATFATQPTSALPRAIPVNVEPPHFADLSKRRREWWLIPVAVASILVGMLTGAYFFSSPSSNEGLASGRALRLPALPEATPTPLLLAESSDLLAPDTGAAPRTLANLPAPKPAVAVPDSPLINLARTAEQQESYNEAIRAYEEFSVANPTAPYAAIARARANNLRAFQGLLANARDAFAEARYADAQQQFAAALKLRPTSKTAQNGWREAAAKLAPTQLPNPSNREAGREPEKDAGRETEKQGAVSEQGIRTEEKTSNTRAAAPKPTPTPQS
jgi:eukaryotic-like serine/threonine-protein kinase